MCSLILIAPLLLVLVGALSSEADHARTAQIVWGCVLAAGGLSAFALMATRKTEVGWEGLRRGFSFAPARSSIPWERVRGFVLEPGGRSSTTGRIWVLHQDPAGIPDAARVPCGLRVTQIDEARSATDKLNAGLGVSEPREELRALRARLPLKLTPWVIFLLVGLLSVVTMGFGVFLGLLATSAWSMRRSRWLLTVAVFDLTVVAAAGMALPQNTFPFAASTLALIGLWWVAPVVCVILSILAWRRQSRPSSDLAG